MFSIDSRDSNIDDYCVERRNEEDSLHLDTTKEEEFVGEGLMSSTACSAASVCNSLTMSQFTAEDLVDTIFYNCDAEQTGWVPVSRLLHYITCIIEAEGHSITTELEDLWLMFDSNGVDVSVSLQTYRDVMERWVDQLRQSSEFQVTSECDNLIEYSSQMPFISGHERETCGKSNPSSAESSPRSMTDTLNFVKYYTTGSVVGCERDYATLDHVELMTEISELKFKNEKIQEQLLKLRGYATHIEEQNVNLTSESDDLKKKLEIFQMNFERHRSVERESLELHDGLARCVAECLLSKERIRDLKKENASLELQVKDLRKELCSAYSEVDNLKLSEDRLLKLISTLKAELEDAEELLKSREVLWNESSLNIKELQDALQDQKNFTENLREEICQQQKKIVKLLSENANLRQQIYLLKEMKNKRCEEFEIIDDVTTLALETSSFNTTKCGSDQSWEITSVHSEVKNMVSDNENVNHKYAIPRVFESSSYSEAQRKCKNIYEMIDENEGSFFPESASGIRAPFALPEFDTILTDVSNVNNTCWCALNTVHHLPIQPSLIVSPTTNGKAAVVEVKEKPNETTGAFASPQHVEPEHDIKLLDLWSVLGIESDADSNPDCQEVTMVANPISENIGRELAALCVQLAHMQNTLCTFAKSRQTITTVGTADRRLPFAKIKEGKRSQSSCHGILHLETMESSSSEHSQKSPSDSNIVRKPYSRLPIGKLPQTNTKSLDHGSNLTPPSVHKRRSLTLSCPNLPSQMNLVTKSTQTEVCWDSICESQDAWHEANASHLTSKTFQERRQRSYSFLAAVNNENISLTDTSFDSTEHDATSSIEIVDHSKTSCQSPREPPPSHDCEKTQPSAEHSMPDTSHMKIGSKDQHRAVETYGENYTNGSLTINEHTENQLARFAGVKGYIPQIKRSCAIELDESDLQLKSGAPNFNQSFWDYTTAARQQGSLSRCSMAEISETESAKGSFDSEPEHFQGMSAITAVDYKKDSSSNKNEEIVQSVSGGVHNKLKARLSLGGIEQLSDEEIANEFNRLALAFRTDSFTRHKRLQLHQRQRELAENNAEKELNAIKDFLQDMQINRDGSHNSDMQLQLTRLQRHIEIVHQATLRVSARSEVYGAIQQEDRVCQSVALMIRHVENLKKHCEKLQQELEQARLLLQDSIIHDVSSSQSSVRSSPKSILLSTYPAVRRRRASVAVDLEYSHGSNFGQDVFGHLTDNKSDEHSHYLVHHGTRTASSILSTSELPTKISCNESIRSYYDAKVSKISKGTRQNSCHQLYLSTEPLPEEEVTCNDRGSQIAECSQKPYIMQGIEKAAARFIGLSRQLHVQESGAGSLQCNNMENCDQKDAKGTQYKGFMDYLHFQKQQLVKAIRTGRLQSKWLVTRVQSHMACFGRESDMFIIVRYIVGGILLLAAAFSLISSFFSGGHLPVAAGARPHVNEWISWEEIIRPYLKLRHPFPPPF